MPSNQFFEKRGPFPLKELIKTIDCAGDFSQINDFDIYGVESLTNANQNDVTFLFKIITKNVSMRRTLHEYIFHQKKRSKIGKKLVSNNSFEVGEIRIF